MKDDEKAGQGAQRQKLEALGQLAGGIAHDFNNILSIIEGHTHIAIRQLQKGTLAPEQLHKILVSTRRGAGLTRQLLSFGRQKVGVEEKTNLAEALRQQHILLLPLLGETVRLSMTAPEDPVWIDASSDQLMQVILNLALNARDAMPEGGDLSVLCRVCRKRHIPATLRERNPDASYIRLSIVDSGTGIPEDILPRIFEPFFTTKDQGKGTGLGLSVVYGVVDQLCGAIEVSSAAGEGTRFNIFLPMTKAPPQDLSGQGAADAGAGLVGKTILIAEDEPELREMLFELFNGLEMKVLSAGNGNQALAVQDQYDGNIDFLLTDVVMPEMDGVKLGEMFSSIRPDSNVVYMSGYPFMDGRRDIQVPEDAPFIQKPLQADAVKKVLERALERRRARLKDEEAGPEA